MRANEDAQVSNAHSIALFMRFAHKHGILAATKIAAAGARPVAVHLKDIHEPIYLRGSLGDREVFRQVFTDLQYSHECTQNLRPSLIIDAGAHIGLASVYFANQFPSARIIAIEPDKRNFDILLRNTRPYPNVTPICAALWPSDDSALEFVNPGDESWAFQIRESPGGDIQAVTFDSLCKGQQPDIIKLDVEGTEKVLFERGAVPACKIMFLELHDRMVPGTAFSAYSVLCRSKFNKYQQGDMDLIEFIQA
jgi:FkbM family methyltransferase